MLMEFNFLLFRNLFHNCTHAVAVVSRLLTERSDSKSRQGQEIVLFS
jgi:uncharacterized Zn finger protein